MLSTGTELIVLGLTRIKDTQSVIHTLSREYGRRSFIVASGKKSSALFMPMNILDAEIQENPRTRLWRAVNISAVTPLFSIRNDIRKNSISMFMSEVLLRAVREEWSEPGLYDWCCRSILTLDSMDSDFSNFHLRFLQELCTEMGFAPSPEGLAPFAESHYAKLADFLGMPFPQAMLMPLNGEERNDMARAILKYLSFHTESSIDARSLKVFREVFGAIL